MVLCCLPRFYDASHGFLNALNFAFPGKPVNCLYPLVASHSSHLKGSGLPFTMWRGISPTQYSIGRQFITWVLEHHIYPNFHNPNHGKNYMCRIIWGMPDNKSGQSLGKTELICFVHQQYRNGSSDQFVTRQKATMLGPETANYVSFY